MVLGIGRLTLRLALAIAILVPLALPASGQARQVRREVAPATAKQVLGRVLRGGGTTLQVQQRRREEAFRRQAEHLSGGAPVPLPPLTGEWTTERGDVLLRELGGGRLMISRPGSWEPDRVYRLKTTTTTVELSGENTQLVDGRFRTIREAGRLTMSEDGNRLDGVLETFDDFARPGKPARGKIAEAKVRWRRKLDLAVPTMMAWRMAIVSAPQRLVQEKAKAEAESKRRAEEAARRQRELEERKRKEQEAAEMEAALLDEQGAGPAIPEMPPLPSLPSLDAPKPAEGAAEDPTAEEPAPQQAGGNAVRRYLTERMPAFGRALQSLQAARKEIGPMMMLNPAGAAALVEEKLVPAVRELAELANAEPAPPELAAAHNFLLEAVQANQAMLSQMSGPPGPQKMQQMQQLGQQSKAKLDAFNQAVQQAAASAGIQLPPRGPQQQ